MFSEPIGKKYTLATFYNFSNKTQSGQGLVYDRQDQKLNLNALSRTYETGIINHMAGASARYSNEGFEVGLGAGYQLFDLTGDFRGVVLSSLNGVVDKVFVDPQYNVNLSYQLDRNSSMGMSFDRGTSAPSVRQLSPVVNNTNPLYITQGNPALQPSVNNNVSYNLWKTMPLKGINMNMWVNLGITQNAISQKEEVDALFVTTTQPINYKSQRDGSLNGSIGFPIVKGKLKSNARMYANTVQNFRLVNGTENKTNTVGYSPSFSLDFTPSKNFTTYISTFIRQSNTSYSINSSQNQSIVNRGFNIEVNAKVIKSLYFTSKYNHNFTQNKNLGQSLHIPIVNASLFFQFLKGKKGELRLSAYDILDRNQSYSLFASDNTVSNSNTVNLARFAMLSFTYNIKGVSAKLTKNSYF